ncbi:uncharacterized protein TNCV_1428081 [Trichonephila clavipes]|nr:uncharacterized protein TNCV_1428081 [Trichonephila clavipes]
MRCFGGIPSCEKCWIHVSPVPARDEVCPPDFLELLAMRCFGGIPSCEKCWIHVSPVPASDECIMAFLLRERKDVLLEVAKELRVEIDITLPKIEFKKRICQSKYYDEESVKCLLEGILAEKRETRESERETREYEERKLIKEFELQRLRAQLSNKLNENKLKAGNRINDLANGCILSENHTTKLSEPVNKGDKGVANPEGLIHENICEEKYTIGTLMGCEKQLTMNRESLRNHTIAKIAGQLNGGKENMCKADVRKGLEDGLAMRLPLSEPREIYKDKLETDNRSNIGSEFTFEIDLPGKRDRSTIYRLNLIKLYRRKPELANLVMENSSEGIDSETLYSVKLFMDFGFQGNLRKSQVYFKLPPDRSSYLRMINAKKKERFLPDPGTIVLRQKDINLVTGKPFRIKTCCSSQMLINSLREDTEYLLDLGVNGMGQSILTLPVVWLGRVNRYPYPRIKCIKYRNLNQVTRAEIYLLLKRERLVGKINAATCVTVLDL